MADRFIRIREVMRLTGLARSTIFFLINTGRFPRQIPLGCAASGWLESEVMQWCEAQVQISHSESNRLGVAKGESAGRRWKARVLSN